MSSENNSKNGDSKFEALKLVYEKAAQKHGTFISWREKLTGGYVAIIAALAIALWKIYEQQNMHFYIFIIFAAGLLISFVFRELDARNAVLYKASQTVALTIEKEFKLLQNSTSFNNTSLFYILDNSAQLNKKKYISHSVLLRYVYNGMILLSGYFLIYSILFYNLHWNPSAEIRTWFNRVFIGFMWIIIVVSTISMIFSFRYFYKEIRGENKRPNESLTVLAEREINEISDLILKFKNAASEELMPDELKNRIKDVVDKKFGL